MRSRRWIFDFLRWFCPDHLLEEIQGDLEEKYAKDLLRYPAGRALFRLYWNTLRFFRSEILTRRKRSRPSVSTGIYLNYFKTSVRHIYKSKLNFTFKLAGLTLAIGSFLVISLYVSFEKSFDQFYPDYQRIYRLNSASLENGNEVRYANVPPALGPACKTLFPEVEAYAGVSEWGQALVSYEGKLLKIGGFVEADSSVFSVFGFTLVRGDHRSLRDPRSIVINESTARLLFGNDDPIFKTISFPDRFNQTLTVGAVIADLPANSSIQVSVIMNFGALRDKGQAGPDNWSIGWGGYNLFLKFRDDADKKLFPDKVLPVLRKNLTSRPDGREKTFRVYLQPLSEIYLGDEIRWEFMNKGVPFYLYVYSGLGIFLLAIAGMNYVNLSIADFGFRNKEAGVRKILGARKRQIVFQLGFETFACCMLALILSTVILYFLFPFVVENLNRNLNFSMIFSGTQLITLSSAILLLIVVATTYPAYQFTINNPVDDLRRKTENSSKYPVNRILMIIQFSIAIFCICAAWVIGSQLRFVQKHELGFDRHNVATIIMPDRYPIGKAAVLKQEILRVAGVDAASFSFYRPTASEYYNDWYDIEIDGSMTRMIVNEVFVDRDVFKTMGHTLLEGRIFSDNPAEANDACLVNETAVKEFGWKQPVGQPVAWGDGAEHRNAHVIGVIKDFNTRSLHKRIEPLMIRLQYDPWPGNCLNIKFKGHYEDLVPRIKTAFSRVMPEFIMESELVDDLYTMQYRTEEKAFSSLQIGTSIIILISCIGIFSLSVFMSLKRFKEFAIRKVLGAGISQIAILHISHFLRSALVANLIALPFSYWILSEWLNNFAYRANLNPFAFIGIGSFLFGLILISTGYSTWKAGRMNPVDAIKSE